MSYTCQDCSKTFSDEKYLKRHTNAKTCQKEYVCKKCGAAFASANNLRKHITKKNPCVSTEVPVSEVANIDNKCEFCGKCYATLYTLKRHIATCTVQSNNNHRTENTMIETMKLFEQKVLENKELRDKIDQLEFINSRLENEIDALKENGYIKAVYINSDPYYEKNLQKNVNRISQWVYFIREIREEHRIKIGLTKCLADRLSNLKTGNSDELEIIAYVETSDMHSLESELHNHFDDYHIKGEWYELDEESLFPDLSFFREEGELP